MSIQSKLAWTFILLLIFGITAISSYSILFIRNYLLDEGVRQIQSDAEWLAITIRNLQPNDRFETNLNEAALTSGYQIAVYDEEGFPYASVPYDEEPLNQGRLLPELRDSLTTASSAIVDGESDPDRLISWIALDEGENPARYLRVSQLKDQIYAPIKTIRWIIYTGMFISIGLVLIVSIWFARYMSKPILQLEDMAKKIASGDVDRTLHLNRSDEFGTLALSLNRMATRLREDHEKLKSTYERQGQFFADITHELRNPLHTLTGAHEMLQMEDLPPAQKRHYLETAIRQTDRINRLFKDLMLLQKYDSDGYFIEKKEFSLSGLMTRMYELYYKKAREKGLELEIDPCAHRVYADPDKMEQVFDNLISNALKYTSSGRIAITCERIGDVLVVRVQDSGIGISAEHLERLFDRFYRTDKARSRDQGGTGLGLAIVKSILDAHGAGIRIESRVGEGTTVEVQLPVAPGSTTPAAET
ncbi:MAG: HAMP domain-containing sensor histidine kinase [Balneolaceae bacterium]